MNTIFTARKVVTMNPANPEAQAVAVRDGRIVCAGTLEECPAWGEARVDGRFAEQVLIPGFVEARSRRWEASPTTVEQCPNSRVTAMTTSR